MEKGCKMNATSPKSPLVKFGLYPSKTKTLKVMVLGQGGVGKSAMVVRFITKRYIGEYDPTLEKVYNFHTILDNEMVNFDILDAAGQLDENESFALEANIRWAEAFILMYSVTDKCSFDECYRLKFLINYNKRRRRIGGGGSSSKDAYLDTPVVLVGNKIDQLHDRMVTAEEGQRRSKEIGCVCFHEISVRESVDQVWSVFHDICRFWRVQSKCPTKLKRSSSDNKEPVSPDSGQLFWSIVGSPGAEIIASNSSSLKTNNVIESRWTDCEIDKEVEQSDKETGSSNPREPPFRGRASTDGHLLQKTWKWRYPPPTSSNQVGYSPSRSDRRMSISMRGNKASY